MNFAFGDDQEELRRAARRFLDKESPPAYVRAVSEEPDAWRSVWGKVVELGWTQLTMPTSAGGLGRGVVDLVALVETTGEAALPVPFLSTVGLAGPVLRAAGHRDGLAVVADGHVVTLAVADTADENGPGGGVWWDGSVLLGSRSVIPDATRMEFVAVVANAAAGTVVALVPATAPGLKVTPLHAGDPSRPLADLTFDHVRADAVPTDDVGHGVDVARTALAAELVGVADRILRVSVTHACERRQFDRPIGAFQAIKHLLADVYVQLERARSLAYAAAMVLDDAEASRAQQSLAASMAKGSASEVALHAAASGVQVHGAIGTTWEHDLHLFTRRARQSSIALGDHVVHYRRVAEAALRARA